MNTKNDKKEKPILFSTPMVRAIIAGQKTMTRRPFKPKPVKVEIHSHRPTVVLTDSGAKMAKRPYNAGDILWVKEMWRVEAMGSGGNQDTVFFGYAAGGSMYVDVTRKEAEYFAGKGLLRPSIFMPRKAARLFLEVKNVRVERLQDISEKDAMAEGVEEHTIFADFDGYEHIGVSRTTPVQAFCESWDDLYAKRGYGWDSNPWVWVIEFERMPQAA